MDILKFIKENELEIYNKNIEEEIIKYLIKNNMTISTAESCTGGMIISTLINVSGSSKVIKESYVTYANEAKIKILGVKEETINKYSVYSKEVALEMVKGLKNITNNDVCISITGLTDGENKGKFDCGIIIKDQTYLFNYQVDGSRNEIRNKQTKLILGVLLQLLKG